MKVQDYCGRSLAENLSPISTPQAHWWRSYSNSWQSVSDSTPAGSQKSRCGTAASPPTSLFFTLCLVVQLPHTGWHSNGVSRSSGGGSGRSNGELSQWSASEMLVRTIARRYVQITPEYIQSMCSRLFGNSVQHPSDFQRPPTVCDGACLVTHPSSDLTPSLQATSLLRTSVMSLRKRYGEAF